MTITATKAGCLIRYIEVWTPLLEDADTVTLESANVIHPDHLQEVHPEGTSFRIGEGAVGSAMKQRGTVIFQDASAALDRVCKTSDLPISAVMAFPVYFDDKLINVVVLGLIDGHGAAEIWTRDDQDELSISGSFYRGLDSFEYISQHVKFPKGAGLPGFCWKHGMPKMLDDPNGNPNFIRSFDRDPATLTSVIGLPISRTYGYPASILLLMSSMANPLAKYTAVLKVDSDQPDEETPFPELKITAIEGSSDKSSEITWHQSAADWVSKKASCAIIAGDAIGGGLHAAIAIPFTQKGKIDRIVVFGF